MRDLWKFCGLTFVGLFALVYFLLPKGVDQLIADLDSPDVALRRDAANQLGRYRKIGPDAAMAVEAVAKTAIEDEKPFVRQQAIVSLQRIGPNARRASTVLIRILREDENPDLRCQSAQALGHIGPADKAVLGALHVASHDSDKQVRAHAETAIRRLTKSR